MQDESLKRVINRITLGFLLGLCIAFIFSLFAASLVTMERKQQRIRSAIQLLLSSQASHLSQELYFNQKAAIELRIDSALGNLAAENLSVEGCLSLTTSRPKTLVLIRCIKSGKLTETPSMFDFKQAQFEEPLRMGSSVLGEVSFAYTKPPSWRDSLPVTTLLILAGVFLVTLVLQRNLVSRLYDRAVAPLLDRMKDFERNQAISSTVKMLAHDVRRPFSLMQLALQIIERSSEPEQIMEVRDTLLRDVKRAKGQVDRMIEDILDLSRTDLRSKKRIDLCAKLEETVKDLLLLHSETRARARISSTSRFSIVCEDQKLIRAISNIVENAIQATSTAQTIAIECNLLHGVFTIGILNTGSFIDEVTRKRMLFSAHTTRTSGTGLGLAIAKHFVALHGGEIAIHSDPATGTRFDLIFPAAFLEPEVIEALPWKVELPGEAPSAPVPDTSHDVQPEALVSTDRIWTALCVDDDSLYLDHLKRFFQRAGKWSQAWRVIMASDARTAAAEIASQPIDFAVIDLDLGLHREEGFALCRLLRDRLPQSGICLHSSQEAPEVASNASKHGADWFFPKPVSDAHFLSMISSIVKRRQAIGSDLPETVAVQSVTLVSPDFVQRRSWEEIARGAPGLRFATFSNVGEMLSNQEHTRLDRHHIFISGELIDKNQESVRQIQVRGCTKLVPIGPGSAGRSAGFPFDYLWSQRSNSP